VLYQQKNCHFQKIKKIDQNKTLAFVCVKDDGMLLGFVWQEIADTFLDFADVL
jgi:hypothetical protein